MAEREVVAVPQAGEQQQAGPVRQAMPGLVLMGRPAPMASMATTTGLQERKGQWVQMEPPAPTP